MNEWSYRDALAYNTIPSITIPTKNVIHIAIAVFVKIIFIFLFFFFYHFVQPYVLTRIAVQTCVFHSLSRWLAIIHLRSGWCLVSMGTEWPHIDEHLMEAEGEMSEVWDTENKSTLIFVAYFCRSLLLRLDQLSGNDTGLGNLLGSYSCTSVLLTKRFENGNRGTINLLYMQCVGIKRNLAFITHPIAQVDLTC